jgi:hypothetical protein
MNHASGIGRALLATSPLLWLLAPPLRHLVEGSMGLHMVLQFPLLLAAGWAAAAWWPARATRLLARVDVNGLASATLASLVAAFWMIPAALDLALLELHVAWLKYLSWIVAGLLLGQGWRRLSPELAAFFCGNAAWMLLTAGLLYRDAETRLCVSYLIDEQAASGNGLFAWGLALGAATLWRLRALMRRAEGARADLRR